MRRVTQNAVLTGKYNDIIRDRRYFGDVDAQTSSIWGTDETILFNSGQGEVTKNLTTGADVTMKKCDTSLFNSNGIIPNAQNFVVMAIGIDIHLANKEATTPFSDDSVTSIDVSPLAVDNPYPLVDAIRSFGVFSLYRNSTEFLEEGNVADYPCGLYNSGWGGDGQASVPAVTSGPLQNAYTVNGFIVAQNGMNFRPLTVWHVLESLDQFHGRFQMCRSLDLTGTKLVGYVDFLLIGQANVDRKSQQMIANFQ